MVQCSGIAKEGQFLAMANDIGTFDVAMCRLMGVVDHKSIGHIRFMAEQGTAPANFADIECNEVLQIQTLRIHIKAHIAELYSTLWIS